MINIFVSNTSPGSSFETQSQRTESPTFGVASNPAYHLDDALELAKEKAAAYQSSSNIDVVIHLFKGDHYIQETRGGSTLPHYKRS